MQGYFNALFVNGGGMCIVWIVPLLFKVFITLNGCIQSIALPVVTFYIWDIPITCMYTCAYYIKLVINILTRYVHTEVYPALFY